MEAFLNTAEDQLDQFAVAGSPVAWQIPKTFGESEAGDLASNETRELMVYVSPVIPSK